MLSGNCVHRSSKPFVLKELNVKRQKYKTVFEVILMIMLIIMKTKNCLKTWVEIIRVGIFWVGVFLMLIHSPQLKVCL